MAAYTFNPNDTFQMILRPVGTADPIAALKSLGFVFSLPPKQNADCTWTLVGKYAGANPFTFNAPIVAAAGTFLLVYMSQNGQIKKAKLTAVPLPTVTLTQCHVYLIGFTYSECGDPTAELKSNGFTKFALYPGPDDRGVYAVLALWENTTTRVSGPMGKLNIVGLKDNGIGKHITSGPCMANVNTNTFVNHTLAILNASAKQLSSYLSTNGCKCADPQLATLTTAFQNAWNGTIPAPASPLTVTGQYGPGEQAALNSMGVMGVVGAPPCYSLANDGSAPCDTPAGAAGATGATGATGGPPAGVTGATGAAGGGIPAGATGGAGGPNWTPQWSGPITVPTPAPAPAPAGLSTGATIAIGVAAAAALGGLAYLLMTRHKKPAIPAMPAAEMYENYAPVEVTINPRRPRRVSRKRQRRGTTRTNPTGSRRRR